MTGQRKTTEVPDPPADLDAEREVLGGLLAFPAGAARVLSTGLQPHHFYAKRHGLIFEAMQALHSKGVQIAQVAVCKELGDEKLKDIGDAKTGELRTKAGVEFVAVLEAEVAAAGNAGHYAEGIIDLWRWRVRRNAVYKLAEATETRDLAAWKTAMKTLVGWEIR